MAASNVWTSRVGQRVVVRYRLEDGSQNDVIGELAGVDHALHVTARSGQVEIRLGDVVAGKVVPPRPSRPGPAHLVLTITDLQAVMSWHWRAPETERLGGWQLRACAGYTGRANSMLPLGDPGTDIDEALARTRRWYGERGLPAKASVAGPADGGVPDDDGPANAVRTAAVAQGWQVVPDGSALVLTARTADLRTALRTPSPPAGLRVTVDDQPDEAWLATYRYHGREFPPAALALLHSAPEQIFVSIRDGNRTVGVARGSLGSGWAGLTAVDVAPERRRQGLGTLLLAAVVDWAYRSGTACVCLQVAESNTTAQALYRRAGFTVHHRYDYLQAPNPSASVNT